MDIEIAEPEQESHQSSEQHMLLDLSTRYSNELPDASSTAESCACHVEDKEKERLQRRAIMKLLIAVALGIIFMAGEAIGGYVANSLAVMTDALHMLTDVTSFIISLLAIWLGRCQPSNYMTFGWKRAEVLGALLSVLMIYGISGALLYEATKRVKDPGSYELNPNIMLIVSCGGIFINVLLLCVLHQGGGHGHSHGPVHSSKNKKKLSLSSGARRDGDTDDGMLIKKTKKLRDNLNVRAASIHVIGDLLQTVGIVITSYLVWFRKDWKIADPICTYIFGVLIIFTTCRIMLDILRILMEGVPSGIDVKELRKSLLNLQGVEMVHSLCVWSVNAEYVAVAGHIVLRRDSQVQPDDLLKKAVLLMKEDYGASYTALQLEGYQQIMRTCKQCSKTQ